MNFSNELNLNFPFYKRQQRYQSHEWNIHSHTGRQNCHKSAKRMSNKESPATTSQHKGSAASGAHHNQQAACPSDTQCSQTVLSGRHTSQPIGKMPKQRFGLGASSACPGVCFYTTREKHSWQPVPSRGETEGDPWNKWFWQLLRTSPQPRLSRPVSHLPWAPHRHPGQPSAMAVGCWKRGNPGGSIMRAQQPHVGHQKSERGESSCLLFWSR